MEMEEKKSVTLHHRNEKLHQIDIVCHITVTWTQILGKHQHNDLWGYGTQSLLNHFLKMRAFNWIESLHLDLNHIIMYIGIDKYIKVFYYLVSCFLRSIMSSVSNLRDVHETGNVRVWYEQDNKIKSYSHIREHLKKNNSIFIYPSFPSLTCEYAPISHIPNDAAAVPQSGWSQMALVGGFWPRQKDSDTYWPLFTDARHDTVRYLIPTPQVTEHWRKIETCFQRSDYFKYTMFILSFKTKNLIYK